MSAAPFPLSPSVRRALLTLALVPSFAVAGLVLRHADLLRAPGAIARVHAEGGPTATTALAPTPVLPGTGGTVTSGAEQPWPKAGIVVAFGDGTVVSECVDLGPEPVTGLELLRRSGYRARIEEGAAGATVCQIEDVGCGEGESCWCACQTVGPDCAYWSYSVLDPGERWGYSEVGAAARIVQPGDVDGWAWGAGTAESGPTPPEMTFREVCAGENASAAPSSGVDRRGAAGLGREGTQTRTTGYVVLAGVAGLLLLLAAWVRARRA